MIVVLGVCVGFIVIAMFMPLVQVIQNLSGGDDDAKSGGATRSRRRGTQVFGYSGIQENHCASPFGNERRKRIGYKPEYLNTRIPEYPIGRTAWRNGPVLVCDDISLQGGASAVF